MKIPDNVYQDAVTFAWKKSGDIRDSEKVFVNVRKAFFDYLRMKGFYE